MSEKPLICISNKTFYVQPISKKYTNAGVFFSKKTVLTVSILAILTSTHSFAENTNQVSNSSQTNTSEKKEDVVDFGKTTVTAKAEEDASGSVIGVAPERTESGTGTDTKIEEIPQSISVVSSQEIEKIGATDIKQAVSYTVGMATGARSDKTSEVVFIRGFKSTGESVRDGRKQKVNYYDGGTETYGLERVEVLKGPASILYGAGSPGGVVNQISKKAKLKDFGEVKLQYGSFDKKQIATDVNKVLSDDISARFIGLYRKAGSSIDHVNDDRVFLSSHISWFMSDETEAMLRAEYQKDNTKYHYGLPVKGTLEKSKWGALPTRRFNGNPNNDRHDKNSINIALDFRHDFSDQLSLTQGVSYFKNKADFNYTNASVSKGVEDRLYRLSRSERDDESSSVTANMKLNYGWQWSNLENNSLFSLNYSNSRLTSLRYQSDFTVDKSDHQYLDFYIPNYSNITAFDLIPANASSQSATEIYGLLLQNQMKINSRWVAILGGRYDKIKADTDLINLRNTPNLFKRYTVDLSEDAVSFRAGLVYLADNGISPYANYSESFSPNLFPAEYGLHKSTYGKQYELGVRYIPKDMDALFTASTYLIKEENSLVPVKGSLFQQQLSLTEAQGFELEAKTQIGDTASLNLGYAYNKTAIKKNGGVPGYKKGNEKPNAPKQTFSALMTSNMNFINQPDLEIGLGVRYVSETATSLSDKKVPAYTVFDASASYEFDDWALSIKGKNLLNNKYIETCTYACFFGEEREVLGEISYRF